MSFDEARHELEAAEAAFDEVEQRYFQRAASTERLRQAWDRRDRARRAYNAAALGRDARRQIGV